MAVKEKKIKWALGSGGEPDDLQDFKDNDQIVRENKGLPPKGIYRLAVRWLRVKPNKNGDDRISGMLVMDEPKGGKGAPWNGYVVWEGFNVTEQGNPYIKRFLKGLGLPWSDFEDNAKQDDQDPPHITRIGKVKFEQGKDPHVQAMLKISPPDDYNTEERLEVQRYIPVEDATDEAVEADEGEDVLSIDAEPAPDESGEPLTLDALKAMKIGDMRDVALQAGIKQKKIDKAGKSKATLIDLIVEKTNLPPF